MATATLYPFDPTGTSSANKITNEQSVITPANFRDHHYYIPKFAPFFEEGFTIRMQYTDGSSRNLVKNVDYYLSNQFLDASRACARPVYGSISFLDTDTAGVLSVGYQTVGGMWNLSAAEITRILAEELRNPRTTAWEQITELPERFPVVDHEWDLIDMVGMKDVQASLDRIQEAVLEASGNSGNSHASNTNNPHQVNKGQVGLGLVENFPIATTQQAQEGIFNQAYMTPARTREAIAVLAGDLLVAHTTRRDNPHQVTKLQIGLGSVQDYPVATQAQALAGVATNAYMTPALVRAVVNATDTSLAGHMTDTMNPHNTTKDQIGLFNLENYPIATAQEAREGTRSDRYMTPQRTTQLVQEFVSVQLDGHATRTDNPHDVSKSQVGLSLVENYGIATAAEMTAGTATNKYVTPALVHNKIQTYTATLMDAHVNNTNNPHSTTAAQVGAYSITQMNNLLLDYLGVNDVAADSALWEGETGDSYRDWLMTNMPGFSADKLAGYTVPQLVALVSTEVGEGFMQAQNNVVTNSGSTTHIWVPVAFTAQEKAGAGSTDPVTNVDNLMVVSGGTRRVVGRNVANDVFMVRSSVRGAPSVKVSTLYSDAAETGEVEFGYVWDAGQAQLKVYAKVYRGADNLHVVDLSGQPQNSVGLGSQQSNEPAGIVYVTAAPSLEARVAAMEQQLNGITVE